MGSVWLQRGRRSGSTEIRERNCKMRVRLTRFKGAVDQGRRRSSRSKLPTPRSQALQRGRRSGSTEISIGTATTLATAALQRGRRSGSTEMAACRRRRKEPSHASKGPSIRVDGDRITSDERPTGVARLQRGRRSGSTEITLWYQVRDDGAVLQRGRRSGSTEIQALQALGSHAAVASKGPSIRVDGDNALGQALQGDAGGFKGAVDQGRRRC